MDMQPVSHQNAEPLSLLSQNPNLRVPASGTVDILALLTEAPHRASIVDLVDALIEHERSAPAVPGILEHIVAPVHAGVIDDPRIAMAFDGRLPDLADLSDDVLQYVYRPPEGFTPSRSVASWVRDWIPETSSNWLERDLGVDAGKLGDALAILADDGEAFALLLSGHPGRALRLGRPFHGLTQEETIELVRCFGRLLALIVASLRVALLRRWSRQPMAQPFAHGCDRPSLARVLECALIDPARDILSVLDLRSGPTVVLDLPAYLARTRLSDPAIVSMVEEVAGRCFGLGSGRLGYDDAMERLRSKLHALVQPVARTTASDLREQGLGKMGFVKDRLGVTASHGTVIVARSLLGAGKAIDAGIEALLAGRPVPSAPPLHFRLSPSDVGKNALRRMTDHLRRCIKPDQESESLGPPRIESDAIAKNNRSSAKLVKTALAQFERCWPEQAIAALSIDPTIWFS